MLAFIPRAAVVAAFVWIVSPHQPDLGLGRPSTIETLIMSSASTEPAANLELSHQALLASVERVRADLRANGTKIGALPFGLEP